MASWEGKQPKVSPKKKGETKNPSWDGFIEIDLFMRVEIPQLVDNINL